MIRGIREKKCNSHLANVNAFKRARDSRGEKNCNIIGEIDFSEGSSYWESTVLADMTYILI